MSDEKKKGFSVVQNKEDALTFVLQRVTRLETAVANVINNTTNYNRVVRTSIEMLQCALDAVKDLMISKKVIEEKEYEEAFVNALVKIKNIKETLEDEKAGLITVDTPAEDGDVIIVNYVAKLGNEEFQGNAAQETRMKIGDPTVWTELNASFLGKKAGDKYEVSVNFPENSIRKDVAGKTAVFAVEVVKVKKAKPEERKPDDKNP
jgi:trigger factor